MVWLMNVEMTWHAQLVRIKKKDDGTTHEDDTRQEEHNRIEVHA